MIDINQIIKHGIPILLVILGTASLVGGVVTHILEEKNSSMRKEEFDLK